MAWAAAVGKSLLMQLFVTDPVFALFVLGIKLAFQWSLLCADRQRQMARPENALERSQKKDVEERAAPDSAVPKDGAPAAAKETGFGRVATAVQLNRLLQQESFTRKASLDPKSSDSFEDGLPTALGSPPPNALALASLTGGGGRLLDDDNDEDGSKAASPHTHRALHAMGSQNDMSLASMKAALARMDARDGDDGDHVTRKTSKKSRRKDRTKARRRVRKRPKSGAAKATADNKAGSFDSTTADDSTLPTSQRRRRLAKVAPRRGKPRLRSRSKGQPRLRRKTPRAENSTAPAAHTEDAQKDTATDVRGAAATSSISFEGEEASDANGKRTELREQVTPPPSRHGRRRPVARRRRHPRSSGVSSASESSSPVKSEQPSVRKTRRARTRAKKSSKVVTSISDNSTKDANDKEDDDGGLADFLPSLSSEPAGSAAASKERPHTTSKVRMAQRIGKAAHKAKAAMQLMSGGGTTVGGTWAEVRCACDRMCCFVLLLFCSAGARFCLFASFRRMSAPLCVSLITFCSCTFAFL